VSVPFLMAFAGGLALGGVGVLGPFILAIVAARKGVSYSPFQDRRHWLVQRFRDLPPEILSDPDLAKLWRLLRAALWFGFAVAAVSAPLAF